MANPNAASPTDPQVLTLFQEELARAAALPGLAPPGPALWPRFAGYYHELAHLPRKVRRALQRRWRRSLGGIALLCALGQAPAPALAALILVDGTTCTLVDAINAANNDAPAGGCTTGAGRDTVLLPPPFLGSIPPLTMVNNNTYGPTGLPVVTSEITISSLGFPDSITRASGAPLFRILAVGETGNLTVENTIVSGGLADFDQDGGGIFNSGTLTLSSSTVSGNTASSGAGGGIFNSGTLTLDGSTVSGNSGFSGGGIRNDGTLTTFGSTVSGNTASIRGGGGIQNLGTLTLRLSTVSGNTADPGFGGGIQNSGTLTLEFYSTVSGQYGGGLLRRFGGGHLRRHRDPDPEHRLGELG